jgi:hypothetical protein
VNRDDYDFIHLYEGQFTSQFLKMLDKPMTAMSCSNIPAIHRRKIPFKPYEDFQERIRAEVVSTNVSPACSDVPDNGNFDINRVFKRPLEQEGDGRNVRRKL